MKRVKCAYSEEHDFPVLNASELEENFIKHDPLVYKNDSNTILIELYQLQHVNLIITVTTK